MCELMIQRCFFTILLTGFSLIKYTLYFTLVRTYIFTNIFYELPTILNLQAAVETYVGTLIEHDFLRTAIILKSCFISSWKWKWKSYFYMIVTSDDVLAHFFGETQKYQTRHTTGNRRYELRATTENI